MQTSHQYMASDRQPCLSVCRPSKHKMRISHDIAIPAEIRAPVANCLLAALTENGRKSLLAHLQPVTLTSGQTLYLPCEPISHDYFPTDALVYLLTLIEGHEALEVGMVGREGMLGTPLALGVNESPVHAVVQGAETALRVNTEHFRQAFQHSAQLQREVCRYIYELMIQMSQTAACYRFHQVEARLSRWLLMTRDRVRSNHFHLTQDLLSNMPGVRRASIAKAAGNLRQRKLISYSPGEINIQDGAGLEAAACQCY